MNLLKILRVVKELKWTQIWHQILNRATHAKFEGIESPSHDIPPLFTKPISRFVSLKDIDFCFLNLRREFSDWNFIGNGALWAYNLNYFDYINQPEMPC